MKLSLAQRRVIAGVVPHLAPRLKLDKTAQRTILFTLAELKVIQELATVSMASARTGMIRNSLRHVADFAKRAITAADGVGTIPKLERVYQFKITLRNSQPPIWRRIQIRDCSLDKLHGHIQTAMGWRNSHLNHFRIGTRRYGDPELLHENFAEFDYEDSTVTKLSRVLPKSGERFQFEYEYDFGDSWYHDVLFEGCVRAERGTRYPICIEGARACPPEDVGGLMGYQEFLDAIADPGILRDPRRVQASFDQRSRYPDLRTFAGLGPAGTPVCHHSIDLARLGHARSRCPLQPDWVKARPAIGR